MTSFQESSSLEEAASIVAGLRSIITDSSSFSTLAGSKKRVSDKGDIIAELKQTKKCTKKCTKKLGADVVGAPSKKTKTIKPPPMDATGLVFAQPDLKPHPFFYYSDHSLEQDEDPLTPITAAGIVPTFPASKSISVTRRHLSSCPPHSSTASHSQLISINT